VVRSRCHDYWRNWEFLGLWVRTGVCGIALRRVFFHERITKRNIFGVFVAIFGILFIILSIGQGHTGEHPSLDPYERIVKTVSQMEFKVYCVITIFCILTLLSLVDTSGTKSYELRSLFANLSLVALFGAYTALSTKALSSMLSFTFARAFSHPVTYILIFIIATTAILQIFFLNRALQCFDATTVVPIHFALFTMSVIIGSAIIFHEFEERDIFHTLIFFIGCCLTFIGVWLITSSRGSTSSRSSSFSTAGAEQDFPEITISPIPSSESLDVEHTAAMNTEQTPLLDDTHMHSEILTATVSDPPVTSVPLTSSGMFIGTVLETRRGIHFLKSRSRSHTETPRTNENTNPPSTSKTNRRHSESHNLS
jgi:drug/metabolite transporter (DMT)-like permease